VQDIAALSTAKLRDLEAKACASPRRRKKRTQPAAEWEKPTRRAAPILRRGGGKQGRVSAAPTQGPSAWAILPGTGPRRRRFAAARMGIRKMSKV
jgi:hypothetical protein